VSVIVIVLELELKLVSEARLGAVLLVVGAASEPNVGVGSS
jgi:hypothetical protein